MVFERGQQAGLPFRRTSVAIGPAITVGILHCAPRNRHLLVLARRRDWAPCRLPRPRSCSGLVRGETMTSLFQAEESSTSAAKKVAVAIAILAVSGLVLWGAIQMALRLVSGR